VNDISDEGLLAEEVAIELVAQCRDEKKEQEV
jgi:hypothetical protein